MFLWGRLFTKMLCFEKSVHCSSETLWFIARFMVVLLSQKNWLICTFVPRHASSPFFPVFALASLMWKRDYLFLLLFFSVYIAALSCSFFFPHCVIPHEIAVIWRLSYEFFQERGTCEVRWAKFVFSASYWETETQPLGLCHWNLGVWYTFASRRRRIAATVLCG